MLKKIISIKGVGAFQAYGPKGDVTLRPFTAVWGPNGVGKSTLCDILRSFSSGDGAPLLGRRSLSGEGEPEVELLFEAGKRGFRNGNWDQSSDPQIHIFDSTYIHENVFVGDFVEHEQKRNLYRVIVGAEGVSLASEVDRLDEALRDAGKATGYARDAITRQVPRDVDVDQLPAWVADGDIDAKILAKQQDVAALLQADAVSRRALLSPIVLPALPVDIDRVLTTTLEGMSADAERRVRDHVAKVHVKEAWLSEGLRSVRDDYCPFCGQGMGATDLLQAFRGFFSEAYGVLKERVSTLAREISAGLGAPALQRLQSDVARNRELGEEWAALVGSSFEGDLTLSPGESAREVLLAALRHKESTPLEVVEEVLSSAEARAYVALVQQAAMYNASVAAFNLQVQEVKGRAKGGHLETAQRDLALLDLRRRRFQEPLRTDCENLRALVREREDLERQKAEAKKRLDDHATTILSQYQAAINRFLQKFGATFSIKRLERRYAGGTPSSSYALEINNALVELGDRKTNRGEPSFRNTLSGGDRSALALAFFLAQVERDREAAKKIVVLDDPFTSQDRSRRLCTQQQIRRLSSRVCQVIVLSHDEAFLSDCCKEVDGGTLKTLQLRRGMIGPILEEWDATAPRGQALQDRQKLKDFTAEGCRGDAGALRDIARTIRPLLEAYLRSRFMKLADDEWLGTDKWLGDMIKVLRENQTKLVEGSALPDELSDINEYSKRYHHEQNTGADTEPIDETELLTYVGRTLALADGF